YYELIREECRPIGAAINPGVATVTNMMCAPTNEEAVARGMSGAQFFAFSQAWGSPPYPPRNPGHDHLYRSFVDRRRARAEARSQASAALAEREPEDEGQRGLYRAGQAASLVGSPARIRDNLIPYENAHLDVMVFLVQCGDRKHEDIMASLELFG